MYLPWNNLRTDMPRPAEPYRPNMVRYTGITTGADTLKRRKEERAKILGTARVVRATYRVIAHEARTNKESIYSQVGCVESYKSYSLLASWPRVLGFTSLKTQRMRYPRIWKVKNTSIADLFE